MDRLIDFDEEIDFHPPTPDHDLFQQCLTDLYQPDSPLPPTATSPLDALCYLEHHTDLVDTPVQDLLQLVIKNSALEGVNLVALRKHIIKRKNQIKRKRAKNRNPHRQTSIPKIMVMAQPTPEEDIESKRQRNRISAQVSRDRRKQRVEQLEERNLLLEAEYERVKADNQRLRAQIEQAPAVIGSFLHNKLTRLLIILGVIFLATTIRDAVVSRGLLTAKTPGPAPAQASSIFPPRLEPQEDPLFESVRGSLSELLAKQPSLLEPVSERVESGVKGLEEVMAVLPAEVTEKLRQVSKLEQL